MDTYTSPLAYHQAEEPEFNSDSFHHCIATLSGHTSYISSLTLAGKTLYSGSSDGEIRSWNTLQYESDGGNAVAQGKGAVKSMTLVHDKLFSAHQDHRIRVWRASGAHKFERLATLPTLSDRAIKLLNPSNQVQIRRHKKTTWVNHVDAVSGLVLSGDESLLYSVSWDRTIKIWRATDFKCLESVTRAHEDAINAIAVSMDGDVYTGSADATIKVWRKPPPDKKHALVATLEKHKSGVNALVLSENGALLYSGASDRSVLVWEIKIKEGEEGDGIRVSAVLRGHSEPVLCLAVASDVICSGSADNTIRVWRGCGGNYSCLAVLEGHQGPVKCLAMAIHPYTSDDSASNYLVYSGSLDCDVKVWQLYV